MNQRLKLNGELRDKTLKIQEELSAKYKKEIAELQTAAARDKVEIAKRAPAALAAEQEKNRVLRIEQGRQSQTIKSLDAQLSGLRSRNLFLDNQNRGLVRDRDVLTAEVDLEKKRSTGLVNELQHKRDTAQNQAKGLTKRERLEFDVLKKKTVLESDFAKEIQSASSKRNIGFQNLRIETQKAAFPGQDKGPAGSTTQKPPENAHRKETIKSRLGPVNIGVIADREVCTHPLSTTKDVKVPRFRPPLDVPIATNLHGRLGKPDLKRAPDKA
jgi:hypothetical protein